MPVFVFSAMLLMCIYLCALVNAETARTLLAELKRRWRLYLIQRSGEHATRVLACLLMRSAAKKHIDPCVVNEVLAACKQEIVERLGKRYADEVLGEPTLLERYF